MKKTKVISNLPVRLPILSTVLYTFLLHYFNVDNLWWGIFIAVYSIYWIVVISVIWTQERIDIFKEGEDGINIGKTKSFAERLKEKLDAKK